MLGQFQSELVQVALQYGITSVPRLDDPDFVSRVVFDQSKPAGTPKERFGYLFPNNGRGPDLVRLRPDLTDAERHEAIGLFRRRSRTRASSSATASYVVSGAPVVVDAGARRAAQPDSSLLLGVAGAGDGPDPALHPAAAAAPAAARRWRSPPAR